MSRARAELADEIERLDREMAALPAAGPHEPMSAGRWRLTVDARKLMFHNLGFILAALREPEPIPEEHRTAVLAMEREDIARAIQAMRKWIAPGDTVDARAIKGAAIQVLIDVPEPDEAAVERAAIVQFLRDCGADLQAEVRGIGICCGHSVCHYADRIERDEHAMYRAAR